MKLLQNTSFWVLQWNKYLFFYGIRLVYNWRNSSCCHEYVFQIHLYRQIVAQICTQLKFVSIHQLTAIGEFRLVYLLKSPAKKWALYTYCRCTKHMMILICEIPFWCVIRRVGMLTVQSSHFNTVYETCGCSSTTSIPVIWNTQPRSSSFWWYAVLIEPISMKKKVTFNAFFLKRSWLKES